MEKEIIITATQANISVIACSLLPVTLSCQTIALATIEKATKNEELDALFVRVHWEEISKEDSICSVGDKCNGDA